MAARPDFAGFDEETGVLNLETLIKPDQDLNFAVPTFVLACVTAPEAVLPEGNTEDAPAFDPPTLPATSVIGGAPSPQGWPGAPRVDR